MDNMKELWLRLGVTIKITDAEAHDILAANYSIANAVLTKIISDGREYVNGDAYIPETCVEYFNEKYDTKYEICNRNFEVDISSAFDASESIKIKDLLDYCKKTADNLENMQKTVMSGTGKDANDRSALGAYAYFAQQEEIYRYVIPKIINSFKKE